MERTEHMTYEKIEEMVQRGELRLHHTALQQGYLSRKGSAVVEPYEGKFGRGYRVLAPRWDTTRYITVTYYTFTRH